VIEIGRDIQNGLPTFCPSTRLALEVLNSNRKLPSLKKKTNSKLSLEEVQNPNKPTCGGLKRRPVRIKGGRCASLRCLCTRSNSSSYRLPRVPSPKHAPASASFHWDPPVRGYHAAGRVAPRVRLWTPAPAVKTVAANWIAQEACPRRSCYAPTGRVHRISARVRLTPWARQPPQG